MSANLQSQEDEIFQLQRSVISLTWGCASENDLGSLHKRSWIGLIALVHEENLVGR